jgi:hypothetical protein
MSFSWTYFNCDASVTGHKQLSDFSAASPLPIPRSKLFLWVDNSSHIKKFDQRQQANAYRAPAVAVETRRETGLTDSSLRHYRLDCQLSLHLCHWHPERRSTVSKELWRYVFQHTARHFALRRAWKLHRMERLHLPGHPGTPAVLRTTKQNTPCMCASIAGTQMSPGI